MRAAILQPPYPKEGEALQVLEWQTEALRSIPEGGADLVLLPENSNCTGNRSRDDMVRMIGEEGARFVDEMRANAKRIGAVIMAGVMTIDPKGLLRNQLTVIPPDGQQSFPYTKIHLVQPEKDRGILPGESTNVFEYKGVRFAAAICFDFYFPELFAVYAEQRPDVLLIASHQRQERTGILEFMTRARAFDTGCVVLRSAPAMHDPAIGGRSMAVAPDGTILADAGGHPGVIFCEFDPKARFMRAASYGQPDKIGDYREVIQSFRRPEIYRGKNR